MPAINSKKENKNVMQTSEIKQKQQQHQKKTKHFHSVGKILIAERKNYSMGYGTCFWYHVVQLLLSH